MSKDKYFTLVFKGDIRDLNLNPLKADTAFGVPIAAAAGDLLVEVEEYRAVIELQEPTKAMIDAFTERSPYSINGKTHHQAAAINAWRAFVSALPSVATPDQRCARCGFERKEHSYNGACYGICGEFVAVSSALTSPQRNPTT